MLKFEEQNLQLPVIRFNFEDIKNAVVTTMQKYTGLVVTEDTLPDSKVMQKELAGFRVKIDSYRKEKKKELSKPIEEFENQCKELIALIEKAEKPIKEGIEIFDNLKREEKAAAAQAVIDEIIAKHGLTEKYARQLTVVDKYRNLTAKISDVREDIEQRAFILLGHQQKEQDMLEIIQDTIENANKTIKTPLHITEFQKLIDMGMPTKDILGEINRRAEKIRLAEQPKPEEPKEEPQSQPEPAKAPVSEGTETESLWYVELKIIATREEMASLGQYLKSNNYNYKKLGEGKVE